MSVYGTGNIATSYAAAPATYAAAPATYRAYGASMPAYGGAYGGAAYGGMQGYGSPYLDTGVIDQQKLDATNALKNQHKLQADMLEHQYNAQKAVLKAECDRNVEIATQQFNQQRLQQEMALEQQYKNQTMQLDMAKQERDLMITSQAAQMTATAQQHKLQIDMQNKMANLYSTGLNAGAAAPNAKPAPKPAAPKPAAPKAMA